LIVFQIKHTEGSHRVHKNKKEGTVLNTCNQLKHYRVREKQHL